MSIFILCLLYGPLILLVGVGLSVWRGSRAKELVRLWAERNGFRVVELHYAFFKGPFFWTASRNQSVYRVVVEDTEGRRRQAWVRCGSWLLGALSDDMQVRWDAE